MESSQPHDIWRISTWWDIANQLFIDARIKGVLFLLSKIGNSDVGNLPANKISEHSIEPDGVIHEDPSISLAWLKGTPLD
jgi:hypothetical protein